MSVEGSLEDWIAYSTPLPWGVAFEPESKTYRIVARTPDGAPRVDTAGEQVVVAKGLSQPDALVLIALRERYRRDGKSLRLVD